MTLVGLAARNAFLRNKTRSLLTVAGVRRGVLEVLVDNAALMQELAGFKKRKLLEALRGRLPEVPLNDLRFKAGVWEK